MREVLTGTLLAAGWLPRHDETRLVEFLKPVKALDLPFLATVFNSFISQCFKYGLEKYSTSILSSTLFIECLRPFI